MRLREWFATHPRPQREKSLLSQLLNAKIPFGEKVARRLEIKLGMGVGFLDNPPENMQDIDVMQEFKYVYGAATEEGRLFLRNAINVVAQTFVQQKKHHIKQVK